MTNTSKKPRTSLGEYRRKIRPKVGQADVAKALDITPSQYSRIECGLTNPSASQVRIIAKMLGLSADEVVGARPIGTDSTAMSETAALRNRVEALVVRLSEHAVEVSTSKLTGADMRTCRICCRVVDAGAHAHAVTCELFRQEGGVN